MSEAKNVDSFNLKSRSEGEEEESSLFLLFSFSLLLLLLLLLEMIEESQGIAFVVIWVMMIMIFGFLENVIVFFIVRGEGNMRNLRIFWRVLVTEVRLFW